MKKSPRVEPDYCYRCGHGFETGELFCRYCGKKRGDTTGEAYDPKKEMEMMQTVYGPPVTTQYRCGACGGRFKDDSFGSALLGYCPFCGKAIDENDVSSQKIKKF